MRTPRFSSASQGYTFAGNSIAGMTRLSPRFHRMPWAAISTPCVVFLTNAISSLRAPMSRAAASRAAATLANASSSHRMPFSRNPFATAFMAASTRVESGLTAAWLK